MYTRGYSSDTLDITNPPLEPLVGALIAVTAALGDDHVAATVLLYEQVHDRK